MQGYGTDVYIHLSKVPPKPSTLSPFWGAYRLSVGQVWANFRLIISTTLEIHLDRTHRGASYRGASPTNKCIPLGPYRRSMRRVQGGSKGGGRSFMGQVFLYSMAQTRHDEPDKTGLHFPGRAVWVSGPRRCLRCVKRGGLDPTKCSGASSRKGKDACEHFHASGEPK